MAKKRGPSRGPSRKTASSSKTNSSKTKSSSSQGARPPKSRSQSPRRKSGNTQRGRAQSPHAQGIGVQRLNKILASAGLGSRREVEELIVQGRVEVDREIVTELSFKADPTQVAIKVDGQPIKVSRPVYYALNKPTGVLSTNRDPDGRMRVIDLVPDKDRVFSVGRLDRSSEGLILLTNDGELAQRLAHPKFKIQKTYFVVVSGSLSREELSKLRKGVHLAEGFARIDGATIRKHRKGCTELEIVLSEGKNREIRRVLARAGHKVVVLRRIAIGPLRLGQLPVGASRELTREEVRALYAATSRSTENNKGKGKSRRRTKKPSKTPGESLRDTHGVGTRPLSVEQAPVPIDDDESFPLVEEGFVDDDFVGDFSASSTGSVLGYDESPDDSPQKSTNRPKPTRKQAHSGVKRPKRRSAMHGGGVRGSAKRGTSGSGTARSSRSRTTESRRNSGTKRSSQERSQGRSQGSSQSRSPGRKRR